MRLNRFLGSSVWLLSFLALTSSGAAQVKPRFMIAFDTSGSMLWDLSGDPTYGDGVGRPAQAGDDPALVYKGVFYGCGTTAGLDRDCDGLPNDSRMAIAKQSVRNMVLAFGDVDWALARFHQDQSANTDCKSYDGDNSCSFQAFGSPLCQTGGVDNTGCVGAIPLACRPGASGNPDMRVRQSGDFLGCVNYDGDCSGGDVLVGFPDVGPFAGLSNETSILKWMDNVETNFVNTTTTAHYCDHQGTGNCELRADGSTPLGGVLSAASSYMIPIRTADTVSSCRPYSVILLTDGEETCGSGPDAQASSLFMNQQIRTYVVGLAITTSSQASLNSIASSGGTTAAYFANNQAELSAALSDIVADSLLSETCNGLDDDCDGAIDEDLPPGEFLSCDLGAQRDATQQGFLVNNPIYAGYAANQPVNEKVVCGKVDDLCSNEGTCAGACSGRDDDCDGTTDEDGNTGSCAVCPEPNDDCDGLDNDCDGTIDEADGTGVPFSNCGNASCTEDQKCGIGVGQCNLGDRFCVGGVLQPCVGAGTPSAEVCDKVDNDCNGLTDDISRDCPVGTNTGECNLGTQYCAAGVEPQDVDGWRLQSGSDPYPGQPYCEGQILPDDELCDSLDHDCNGNNTDTVTPLSDLRLGASCGPGVAECDGIVACDSLAEDVYCMGERPQPYGPETCNGFDEDCDGTVDETPIADMNGGPSGAFCGTTATNNGECNTGAFACVGAAWTCGGEVPPAGEICDTLDNDCDGKFDEREAPNLDPRLDAVCGSDVGECTPGATVCTSGVPTCTPLVTSTPEICDGLDNDCDGLTDEQVLPANDNRVGVDCATDPMNGTLIAPASEPCVGGAGTCGCSLGATACAAGAIVCQGDVGPQPEQCNDFDDDCDGVKDDGNPGGGGACGNTTGECTAGAYQCQGGGLVCVGGQGPVTEICDGKDNDCDGQTDDGVSPATDTQLGVSCSVDGLGALVLTSTDPCPAGAGTCDCQLGLTACSGGGVVCSGYDLGQAETCDDFDNDCDGAKDNGNPGGGAQCGTDEGECDFGAYQCQGGSQVCVGGQGPVDEICDGKDNDCDGEIDNGVTSSTDPRLDVTCYEDASDGSLILTPSEPCPGGAGSCDCQLGVTACSGGAVVCTNHVLPQPEVCDDADNDCDGVDDNGNPEGGGVCGSDVGECHTGLFECQAGNLVCTMEQGPTAELCDGKDNNCNGLIDDGSSPATDANLGLSCQTDPGDGDVILTSSQPCPLGAGTCPCTLGSTVCSGGGVVCNDLGPEPEICDDFDNDCDGSRDEREVPNFDPRLDVTCGTGIGECEPGLTMCVNGTPACTPLIAPMTESCNGKDDNCNGLIDDNIPGDGTNPCWDSALNPNPTVGTCKRGVERCINSTPTCDGEIRPSLEFCDGLDSNCNGVTDDVEDPGGGQVCGKNTGVCMTGITQCVFQNSMWSLACNGEITGGTEVCNGDDDDCDGLVDEGDLAGGNCYEDIDGVSLDPMDGTGVSGVGVCMDGVFACQIPIDALGVPQPPARNVCVNAQGPSAEFCDGKDNDCDGKTDEGNPPGAIGAGGAPCGSDVGVCQMGALDCQSGQQVCMGEVGPSVEICDGMNNDCDESCTSPVDCDELVDEGIPLGSACSTSGKGDVGECVPGLVACSGGGEICQGEVLPSAEVCDSLDNDCDNKIDESLGLGGACGSDVGQCQQGSEQCVKGLIVCAGEVPAQTETCDCSDNDCDMVTDEAPKVGTLCPAGSSCVQCQCALPCSNPDEFGTRCPSGKAAVDGAGGCFCVGDACDDTDCAGQTLERDGEVLCSPDGDLGTCQCKNNQCSFICDGVSCADGTVCNPNTGSCERESCVLPQFKCADDERCNGESGECEPDPCASADCKDSQGCRDGSCFDSCANVACDSGERCADGACEADPCAGVKCGKGEVCNPADASCVVPDGCVVSGCGSGTVCDVVAGCVSDPCLGTDCPARQICELGQCIARCSGGQIDCNDTCIDPQLDPMHCGASDDCAGSAAGVACGEGEFCVAGECSSECPAGRVGCDGVCVDPMADMTHCGAADDCQGDNAGKTCVGGTTCQDGVCAVFVMPGTDGGLASPDAGTVPPSKQKDTNSRVLVTGGGGCSCSVPAASQPGGHGGTAGWSLALGLFGVLVYRRRRRQPGLSRGTISAGLTALLVTLAGPSQGCNVDPFCLDCGEPKPGDGPDDGEGNGFDNQNPKDAGGSTAGSGGGSGLRDGGTLADGSVPRDGSTGGPVESCNGEDDDGDDKIDEDFDVQTDLANCGACGQSCVPDHAFGECVGGACQVKGCDVGFLDLDNDSDNGCEYRCIPSTTDDSICDFKDNDCDGDVDEDLNLNTDKKNCGGCGVSCNFVNASAAASCLDGDCVFDTTKCDPGWHDLDGNAANGCEYACVKNPASPDVELCNLVDDDCDRNVDEGVSDLGMGRTVGVACGTDEGECSTGLWQCQVGKAVCAGQVGPTTEKCDGVDNDCDGAVDTDSPDLGKQCGNATGACNPGALVIPAGGCTPTQGLVCGGPSFIGPAVEICDGQDNDCDALIDEPDAVSGLKPEAGKECTNDQSMPRGINFAPTSSEAGECQHGVTVCASGLLVCQGEVVAQTELCDGKDNDCNGPVDDGLIPGGPDSQIGVDCGEDRGQCTAGQIICDATGNYFCDRTGQVGPEPETCDSVDNDCDGTIDEAAGAVPVDPNKYGAEGGQSCERDATTGDIVLTSSERCPGGASNCPCLLGVSACSGGSLGCLNYVLPAAETCDNVDNDCNGMIDDGNPGGGSACGIATGECAQGTYQCSAGGLTCVGATGPGVEICDGLDNDCNGIVDDNIAVVDDPRMAVSCFTGAGGSLVLSSTDRCAPGVPCSCTLGATVCSAGQVVCAGDVGPSPEQCDAFDHDCDGSVDNGNPGGGAACGSAVGECSKGTRVCQGGTLNCVGNVGPQAETCDGKDNDCDGLVDDSILLSDDPRLQQACRTVGGVLDTSGTDPCAPGVPCSCSLGATVCSAGAVRCSGEVGPTPETCNDFDDDCDGVEDDGNPGGGGTCGVTTGECDTGSFVCTGGSLVCSGNTGPATEVCDGLDNDCDGLVDDNITSAEDNRLDQSCRTSPLDGSLILTSTDPCAPGVPCSCSLGATICENGAIACGGDVLPDPAEQCDAFDHDCDGSVDNGNPGGGGACGTDTGECSKGSFVCQGGSLVCQGGTQPSAEICDNLDNNCNGAIDDGVLAVNDSSVGQSCYTNGMGALVVTGTDRCPLGAGTCSCTLGATVCATGTLKCSGDVGPSAEQCDAFDHNCDGNYYSGVVDLGAGRITGGACGTSTGECSQGTWACNAGSVGCNGAVTAGTESCNGRDDDCDGSTDEAEGAENPLYGSQGGGACPADALRSIPPCTAGTMACKFGALQCEYPGGAVLPTTEICDNQDNDCDGTIDDGFAPYDTITHCGGCNQPCNFPTAVGDPQAIAQCVGGICGVRACKSGYVNQDGNYGNGCEYQCTVSGSIDVCDGNDNDCDLATDEDISSVPPQVCVPYKTGVCILNDPTALDNAQDCVNGTPTCVIPTNIHPQYQVTETLCDGLDNDCDGKVDEGYDVGVACDNDPEDDGTPTGACFATGAKECNGTKDGTTCVLSTTPPSAMPEICNGIDDDCNGTVDDFAMPGPTNPVTGLEFVHIVSGDSAPNWDDVYMMRYEASRADALTQNTATAGVCSRPGVFPWANINWDEASDACCGLNSPPNGTCDPGGTGWRLCDVDDWQTGCEGPGGLCSWAYDDVSVAQDPVETCVTYAGPVGGPYGNGTSSTHTVNVPVTGTITDVNILNFEGNVAAFEPIGFTLAHGGTTIQLLNNNNCTNNDDWRMDFDDAAGSGFTSGDCTNGDNGDGNPQRPVQALSTFNTAQANGDWVLTVQNTTNCCAGTRYTVSHSVVSWSLQVCYLQASPNESMCTADNPSFPDTCNGSEVGPASCSNGGSQCADVAGSSDFPACFADWGSGLEVYDLSGNLKEWTNTSPLTDVYYLRGGSYNNVEDGRTCDFDQTSARRDFRFPTTGFRCCYYE